MNPTGEQAAPATGMSREEVQEMISQGQVLTKPGQGMQGANLGLIEVKIETPKESGKFMTTRMKRCPKQVIGSIQAKLATLHQSMTSYEVLKDRFEKQQNGESDGDPKKQIEAWDAGAELEERFLQRTIRIWNEVYTVIEPFYHDGEKLAAYKMEQLGVFVVQYMAGQQLTEEQRGN